MFYRSSNQALDNNSSSMAKEPIPQCTCTNGTTQPLTQNEIIRSEEMVSGSQEFEPVKFELNLSSVQGLTEDTDYEDYESMRPNVLATVDTEGYSSVTDTNSLACLNSDSESESGTGIRVKPGTMDTNSCKEPHLYGNILEGEGRYVNTQRESDLYYYSNEGAAQRDSVLYDSVKTDRHHYINSRQPGTTVGPREYEIPK